MRMALVGAALIVIGAGAVISGILPASDAIALGERVWPILLFVVAITITTELAAEAGVFDALARLLARWGRGRGIALWLLVVVLAALSTIFLSLDTTAVLLTPIVVILARSVGLSPLPFALTTVWLANTASLVLPVSNLTNLLAEHRLDSPGPLAFAALTWAPAAVAIVLPVIAVGIIYRRALTADYSMPEPERAPDRALFVVSASLLALLIPALVSGLPVWMPASAAAIIMTAAFAVRRPSALRFSVVPWQLIVFAAGLFLVMDSVRALGSGAVLGAIVGPGNDLLGLVRVAGVGALGANAIDNLPAYLALEPIADSPRRLIALLIGVNVGPLITPWASLATLLWHERLASMHVDISWRRYMLLGLLVAPVTVIAATVAFVLAAG